MLSTPLHGACVSVWSKLLDWLWSFHYSYLGQLERGQKTSTFALSCSLLLLDPAIIRSSCPYPNNKMKKGVRERTDPTRRTWNISQIGANGKWTIYSLRIDALGRCIYRQRRKCSWSMTVPLLLSPAGLDVRFGTLLGSRCLRELSWAFQWDFH